MSVSYTTQIKWHTCASSTVKHAISRFEGDGGQEETVLESPFHQHILFIKPRRGRDDGFQLVQRGVDGECLPVLLIAVRRPDVIARDMGSRVMQNADFRGATAYLTSCGGAVESALHHCLSEVPVISVVIPLFAYAVWRWATPAPPEPLH